MDAFTPASDLWSRLSADPRRQPSMRASDADRQLVLDALGTAFQDGRLDAAEHGERVDRALAVRTVGEVVPLVEDLVAGPGQDAVAARQSPPVRTAVRASVMSWVALAVLLNLIWLGTWVFSGHGPYYYWPFWPMLGTGIPVVAARIGWGATRRSDSPHRR